MNAVFQLISPWCFAIVNLCVLWWAMVLMSALAGGFIRSIGVHKSPSWRDVNRPRSVTEVIMIERSG